MRFILKILLAVSSVTVAVGAALVSTVAQYLIIGKYCCSILKNKNAPDIVGSLLSIMNGGSTFFFLGIRMLICHFYLLIIVIFVQFQFSRDRLQ